MIEIADPSLAADRLGIVRSTWTDIVVPQDIECLPHSRYAPIYDWMYTYEKTLRNRLRIAFDRPLGTLEGLLFGVDGVLSEALSNAFVHGHRRDPGLSLSIESRVGENSLFLRIDDRGPGFDVASLLSDAKRNRQYFNFAGNGFRVLLRWRSVRAIYAADGRSLALVIRVIDNGRGRPLSLGDWPTEASE